MTPTQAEVAKVQRAIAGHVDAVALHTALALDVPRALAGGPLAYADVAAAGGLEPRVVEAVLEALASTGLLARDDAGAFALAGGLERAAADDRGAELAAAGVAALEAWPRLGSEGSAEEIAAAVLSARRDGSVAAVAARGPTAAALMELADRGMLSAIAAQPATRGELAARVELDAAVLDPLLGAARDAGIVAADGERLTLTEAAHQAFGRGVVRGHVAWAERRLVMDRRWFWGPLGRLVEHARGGASPSETSAPGHSGAFRRDFSRGNRPLLALLRATARAVARDLDATAAPLRVLELGPSLGWWGVELAAAHDGTTVTAVDAAEVLPAARAAVDAAGLSERYAWHADPCHEVPAGGRFDVVVVNELCHTFDRASLPRRLEDVAKALSPRGRVLVADMVLDAARSSPAAHLRSALKLRATGGGRVHAAPELGRLVRAAGLGSGRLYRLGTTDLLAATRGGHLPPALSGRAAEAV